MTLATTTLPTRPNPDFDFSSLLDKGDKVRRLLPNQVLDLKDYIKLTKEFGRSHVSFMAIRSNWVTENGRTIWQLARKYSEATQPNVIDGMSDVAPVALIQWILNNDQNNQ